MLVVVVLVVVLVVLVLVVEVTVPIDGLKPAACVERRASCRVD